MTKLHCNPKALYSYVRDKNKIRSTISQLEKPDGIYSYVLVRMCNEESAEVLNSRFLKSVYVGIY